MDVDQFTEDAVREIMARLGGSLTYRPGGGGTRFVVRLPLGLADVAAARSVAE